MPLAVPIVLTGLAVLGTWAGVQIVKSADPVTLSSATQAAQDYIYDFGNNVMIKARLTMDIADIIAHIGVQGGKYPLTYTDPLFSHAIPYDYTCVEGTSYGDGATKCIGGFYYNKVSGVYSVRRMHSEVSAFAHTSSTQGVGLTPSTFAAAVAVPAKNAEIAMAMGESLQEANPDHSAIPVSGITIDGTTLTVNDINELKAFKASADAQAALDDKLAASAAAAAAAVAANDAATAKLTEAEALRDQATIDAAADPTNIEKQQALADAIAAAAAAALDVRLAQWDTASAAATTKAAEAAAAAATATAAADKVAVDAVDVSLPAANVYDPMITPPEKKDIGALLLAAATNSPLSRAVGAMGVESADPRSEIVIEGVYGRTLTISLLRWEPSMRAVGAVAVLIAEGFAILVVLRGDYRG